jgi:putative ABC transport system permease protein
MIKKLEEGDRLIGSTVFVFPVWLYFASVAFAVVVTTVAAYYPATRAARVHPIEALRYG